MGTIDRPGCYEALSKAEPDEPLFPLLARDPGFTDTVLDWCITRLSLIRAGKKPIADCDQVAEALAIAVEGEAWRIHNRPQGPHPYPVLTESSLGLLDGLLRNLSGLREARRGSPGGHGR